MWMGVHKPRQNIFVRKIASSKKYNLRKRNFLISLGVWIFCSIRGFVVFADDTDLLAAGCSGYLHFGQEGKGREVFYLRKAFLTFTQNSLI